MFVSIRDHEYLQQMSWMSRKVVFRHANACGMALGMVLCQLVHNFGPD